MFRPARFPRWGHRGGVWTAQRLLFKAEGSVGNVDRSRRELLRPRGKRENHSTSLALSKLFCGVGGGTLPPGEINTHFMYVYNSQDNIYVSRHIQILFLNA